MTSNILKGISKETGLIIDKDRDIVYGTYKGFPVSIKQTPDVRMVITVSAKKHGTSDNQAAQTFLGELKQSISQIKQISATENCISCIVKARTYKKNIKFTTEVLSKIISFCSISSMVPCCQNCGYEQNTNILSVDGEPYILCNSCILDIENGIEEKRAEIKSRKVNYIGGLVGAFLGSLIGVVLWVVIYQMGYVAAISGLAFAICSIKGFEKLGGKLNVIGVIASLLVAIGMLYIAENIAFAIEIYKEFKFEYDITFFDAYKEIGSFMLEPEIKRSVYGDLAKGYFMMLIAGTSSVIQAFKSMNNIVEVKRLEKVSEKTYTI